MERLTHQGEHGPYWDKSVFSKHHGMEEDLIIDRLAAYEDTGLEPEEIHGLCEMDKRSRMAQMLKWEQAQDEGRLEVLPCKVGTYLWMNGRKAVVEEFFGYETERYLHCQFFDDFQYFDVPFDAIGKTVFLTREEAKAAMKGGNSDGEVLYAFIDDQIEKETGAYTRGKNRVIGINCGIKGLR